MKNKLNSLINYPYLSEDFLITEDSSIKFMPKSQPHSGIWAIDPLIIENYQNYFKFENKIVDPITLGLDPISYSEINLEAIEILLNLNILYVFKEDKLLIKDDLIKVIRPIEFVDLIPEVCLTFIPKKMKENFLQNLYASFVKHYKKLNRPDFSFKKETSLEEIFEHLLNKENLNDFFIEYQKINNKFNNDQNLGMYKNELFGLSKKIYGSLAFLRKNKVK